MKHTLFLAASIALLTAASIPGAPAQAKEPSSVSAQDRSFVRQAAAADANEIACGSLASKRASDPAVQQFGRGIVTDHTALNRRLIAIARDERIPVPRFAPSCDPLKNATGPGFDQIFLKNARQDHEKAIALFRKETETGKSQGLRNLAKESLTALQAHLDEAGRLLEPPAGGAMGTSHPEIPQPRIPQPNPVLPEHK